MAGVPAAIPTLFGPSGRNNATTWSWAVKRYGGGALLRLAVALEAPLVRKPANFFGHLVTSADDVDIAENIARVRAKNPPQIRLDLPEEGLTRRLYEALQGHMDDASFNRHLHPDHAAISLENGTLRIETRSALIAERLEAKFLSALRVAAKRLGADRVKITPRA